MMVVADDYMALEQPLLMNPDYYNKTSAEATKI
jgi:MFS family permease